MVGSRAFRSNDTVAFYLTLAHGANLWNFCRILVEKSLPSCPLARYPVMHAQTNPQPLKNERNEIAERLYIGGAFV